MIGNHLADDDALVHGTEVARGFLYRSWETLSCDPAGTGAGEELQPGDPARIGPFRVVRRLGSGGMGRVFLCVSPGGRPVAVKLIRADLAADREFRTRFRREVQAAGKVSGLYTALLVDADVDGPLPWLATAYVPGPPLADAVRDHGPLSPGPVFALAAGLAESLAAIHAAGVVHRDLKPSNILLADDGPRVIDFGISRAADASVLTTAGLIIGSPGFLSPEQADGGEVGPPSDIFSFGAVLAYAATGHSPFGTGSTPALVYRVVHAAPALDGIPTEVRDLAGRCLAKNPDRRPTAADVLAELSDAGITAGWLPAVTTRPISGESHSASRPHPETITAAGDAAFSATVTWTPASYRSQDLLPPDPAPIAALAPA
jgi:eukaryotic-like serine/threonine-protein kinase